MIEHVLCSFYIIHERCFCGTEGRGMAIVFVISFQSFCVIPCEPYLPWSSRNIFFKKFNPLFVRNSFRLKISSNDNWQACSIVPDLSTAHLPAVLSLAHVCETLEDELKMTQLLTSLCFPFQSCIRAFALFQSALVREAVDIFLGSCLPAELWLECRVVWWRRIRWPGEARQSCAQMAVCGERAEERSWF